MTVKQPSLAGLQVSGCVYLDAQASNPCPDVPVTENLVCQILLKFVCSLSAWSLSGTSLTRMDEGGACVSPGRRARVSRAREGTEEKQFITHRPVRKGLQTSVSGQ